MKKPGIRFAVSLQILLTVAIVPHARAVEVTEYVEMFHEILENLRTNYWSEDGNWAGDSMYDAGSFAPQILYRYGSSVGDQDLIDKANRTVDRNIDLLMELMEGDTSNEREALIGATSILDAIVYYTGTNYADLPMEELAWTAMRLGKNTIIQDPNPMGSYVGYIFPFGALAYASQYYAAKVGGVLGFTAALDGRGVLKMARERFWHQETIGDETVSYYYDPDPSHYSVRMDAYGNGPMLAALALAYGTTHIRTYSIQATSLLDSFDAFLWDRYRGGYWENLSRLDYKGLSSNVAFLRAILDLYDATGRPDLLNQAREILVFIERDLFIEDTDKPGFLLCSHDWIPFRGPTTTHFCTGCNFALLEGIFRLNELVQNGPTYPGRILVCGTLPGEEYGWRDVAVYMSCLAVPLIWTGLKRRAFRSRRQSHA
jgi:hypothetical protein